MGGGIRWGPNGPEAMRAASKAASDAAGTLRGGADCAGPIGGVASALPGGKASGAASAFSASWTNTFTGWCTEADQYAANLAKAAENYRAGRHGAPLPAPLKPLPPGCEGRADGYLSDVKRWNTGQLDKIFRTVQQRLQILTHSGDDDGKRGSH